MAAFSGIQPGMSRRALAYGLLLCCALPALAQTGTAPVLTQRPAAPYPAQAQAAHVTGEAVVAFSIDPSGKTVGVHRVSGPEQLAGPLADEIVDWRFVTPLPRDAEKDFVAVYTYSIVDPEDAVAKGKDAADKGKPPSDSKGEEGYVVLPGPIAAVSGVVHSVNNRQTIDATPSVRSK